MKLMPSGTQGDPECILIVYQISIYRRLPTLERYIFFLNHFVYSGLNLSTILVSWSCLTRVSYASYLRKFFRNVTLTTIVCAH